MAQSSIAESQGSRIGSDVIHHTSFPCPLQHCQWIVGILVLMYSIWKKADTRAAFIKYIAGLEGIIDVRRHPPQVWLVWAGWWVGIGWKYQEYWFLPNFNSAMIISVIRINKQMSHINICFPSTLTVSWKQLITSVNHKTMEEWSLCCLHIVFTGISLEGERKSIIRTRILFQADLNRLL